MRPFGFHTADTADSPQLQFIEGRRHPLRSAEADLHRPDFSADDRDSLGAVRFQVCRCHCCAGRAGSLLHRGAEADSMVQTVRLTMVDILQLLLLITVADVPVVVLQFSSAHVEEIVELPRLHSLRNSSNGAAHHRDDELMG